MDSFLRYVGISELGLYTILGSKPITQFHIPKPQPHEELVTLYNAAPAEFRKKISFRKFDTTEQVHELRDVCKKWDEIQQKYIGKHFSIRFSDDLTSGFLVNIPLATYILVENYEVFSSILQMSFDPSVAAKEIGSDSSEFWEIFKKCDHSLLWGLLFGYGEKNAKLFHMEKEQQVQFPFRVASYHSPWLHKKRFMHSSLSEKVENLDIPQFIIYQPVDEMVEKYSREKERILQIYKRKDFAEITVAFLKGEAVQYLSKKERK